MAILGYLDSNGIKLDARNHATSKLRKKRIYFIGYEVGTLLFIFAKIVVVLLCMFGS